VKKATQQADVPSVPGSRGISSSTLTAQRQSPAVPLSHLPLVGREADVLVLKDCYQAVQQVQTQVVTIEGVAGIGKTHLASSFLSWAATQGAALLQGSAFEMGGRLPYQPLVHAFSRRLEAEPAPEALLSTTWLSELSRILPELRVGLRVSGIWLLWLVREPVGQARRGYAD